MGLCREKRARAKILGRCGRSSLSSIWNLEEPSTFCESWHRGGHGGVLGSSRFGLLLFFDFWLHTDNFSVRGKRKFPLNLRFFTASINILGHKNLTLRYGPSEITRMGGEGGAT